jgi:hypothetical protein
MKVKVKVPLYFAKLVIHQVGRKGMEKLIAKHELEKYKVGFKTHDAFVFKDSAGRYRMLFKKEYCNARVVAHEGLHVVNFMFTDLRIEYDCQNDEHAAYLLGWVVGQCHKVLKLNAIKDG